MNKILAVFALLLLATMPVFAQDAAPEAAASAPAGPAVQIGDVAIDNADIKSWSLTTVGKDQIPYLDVIFDAAHGKQITDMTTAKKGQAMKIMLCGKQVAEPVIGDPIHGNTALLPLQESAADQTACLDAKKKK